jgi:hypothetical protein
VSGHDTEVVGDQDQRGPHLLLGGAERFEHLGLDGHVECGRGLVGDHHVGIIRHGDGDHDPLPHATGKLMRVAIHPLGRPRDAHQLQQLDRPAAGRLFRYVLPRPDRLGYLPAHCERGVE